MSICVFFLKTHALCRHFIFPVQSQFLASLSYVWRSGNQFCSGLVLFFHQELSNYFSLQARFIAQIVIVGAQVVGRAFTEALRQEFQSKFKWCNRSPIHLLDWLAKRNKYCSFLATISYHLAYWSSTLIVSWKCQWIDWTKFHRMLMHITLPNELCTVLKTTLFKGYVYFFITIKLA